MVQYETTSAPGRLCRSNETPPEAQNCWCLQIHENFSFGKMLQVIMFCGAHDPIISVQKKLYTPITELEHFTNTLWRSDKRPNTSDRGTCWTQNDDRTVTSSKHITHTSSLDSTSSTKAVRPCVWLPPVERLWHSYSSSTLISSAYSFNRIWIKIKNIT